MQQADLWHDTILDAIGSAVNAAGGAKKVAGKLWPTLDSTSGAARIRAGLSPDHAQKLCPLDVLMIAQLAHEAGDHSIMNFLGRVLGYVVEPISAEETKKRAVKARKKALLDELRRLEDVELT